MSVGSSDANFDYLRRMEVDLEQASTPRSRRGISLDAPLTQAPEFTENDRGIKSPHYQSPSRGGRKIRIMYDDSG